jgi:hypothetical protein
VLTFEQARILRCALTVAGYTQEFEEEGKAETWFAPEETPRMRVFFFSPRDAGVVVDRSEASDYKTVTFEEAMEAVNV